MMKIQFLARTNETGKQNARGAKPKNSKAPRATGKSERASVRENPSVKAVADWAREKIGRRLVRIMATRRLMTSTRHMSQKLFLLGRATRAAALTTFRENNTQLFEARLQ
jgi:hypothetical protein